MLKKLAILEIATAINIQVSRNREEVYVFVSKVKRKAKRVIVVSFLGFGLRFGNVQPASYSQSNNFLPQESKPEISRIESRMLDIEDQNAVIERVVETLRGGFIHVFEAEDIVVRLGKNPNQKALREIKDMKRKLADGNENPGIGNRYVKGLKRKNVIESRGHNGGRIYHIKYKEGDQTMIKIIGESDKATKNQKGVIKSLREKGY